VHAPEEHHVVVVGVRVPGGFWVSAVDNVDGLVVLACAARTKIVAADPDAAARYITVSGCEHHVGRDETAAAKLLYSETHEVDKEGVAPWLLHFAASHDSLFN
jgi:hypothetical protein